MVSEGNPAPRLKNTKTMNDTNTQPPAAGEAAHTPTPWTKCEPNHEEGHIKIIEDRDDEEPSIIAEVDIAGDGIDLPTGEANAAFIVRACNSHAAHEALAVKADELERCANLLACAKDRSERNRLTVKLATAQYEYKQARAALAAAKEGSK